MDKHHPVLHLVKLFFIDEAAGLLGKRHVDGDEVGLGEELLKAHDLDPHLRRLVGVDVRIVGDHPHLEPFGPFRHHGADTAKTYDTQGLSRDFPAHKFLLFPFTCFHGSGGLRNIPGQGQHHRDGVFCRRNGITTGTVHHHDTAPVGCFQIHVIKPGSRPGDEFELGGGFDDLCGHFGGTPDDNGLYVLLKFLDQLLFRQPGFDHHL